MSGPGWMGKAGQAWDRRACGQTRSRATWDTDTEVTRSCSKRHWPAWESPQVGPSWHGSRGRPAELGPRAAGNRSQGLGRSGSLSCIGEGNGNPLQCSCLENPRDRGAWWAAVSGVT